LRLSALAMALSLVFAVLGAFARTSGPRWLRMLVGGYVEVIRNTPFLVQIFMLYFGLPSLGLRLDATIEIVRAGIESVGRGQIEAAGALGLGNLPIFRLVVLPQALRVVMPPLGSQFILLMLNSSVVSVISADELTAAAQDVQSRTFRPFESFITATLIYLLLSLLFTGVFAAVERAAFGRKLARR